MKTKSSFLFLFIIICIAMNLKGQDIRLQSGDLQPLKQEKKINLIYSFDKMAIGELKSEAEYIARKIKEHNDQEPGKGDKWVIEWHDNKTLLFERSFELSLNTCLKKYDVVAEQNEQSAKYTIRINTIFLEPGWSGWAVAHKNSEILLEITIYKTQDKEKTIGKISLHSYGKAGDYSSTSGIRISSAYESAGKILGKYLCKSVYK